MELSGSAYYIDFERLTQSKVETGYTRSIRWQGTDGALHEPAVPIQQDIQVFLLSHVCLLFLVNFFFHSLSFAFRRWCARLMSLLRLRWALCLESHGCEKARPRRTWHSSMQGSHMLAAPLPVVGACS